MALTAADVRIGIMEARRQRRDQVRFIQVRHEEAAALMACGYAKVTGRLGVCLATSGPDPFEPPLRAGRS
jgi:thiamine pyrophosphate-dependent acetolactate synthase large subunit-like protein